MATEKKEAAYVLPEDAVSSSEPQHFGVVPGLWTAGEPVAVSDLGLTADEMAALVKEHNLPLKKTTAAPKLKEGETPTSAEAESAPNPVVSGAEG
jgi:hypothetical protein